MAVETKAHGHIHSSDSHGALAHIAMAGGTVHFGAEVRRVVKLDVHSGTVIVNALPGNILTTFLKSGQFDNFRIRGGNHLVARHTKAHRRNSRVGALIHAHVAVRALHAFGEVDLVRKRDGLDGFAMAIEEIVHRRAQVAMCGCENGRWLLRGGRLARFGRRTSRQQTDECHGARRRKQYSKSDSDSAFHS